MSPARAFFASTAVSLMVLTLSYQATVLPAALAAPTPKPVGDGWMAHAEAKSGKASAGGDLSELAPLVSGGI